MHAVQKSAEDLRAELDAVRAEMGRAAQQAEAARQGNAKHVCRIQTEGEAQVCLPLSMYLLPVSLIRALHCTRQSAWYA